MIKRRIVATLSALALAGGAAVAVAPASSASPSNPYCGHTHRTSLTGQDWFNSHYNLKRITSDHRILTVHIHRVTWSPWVGKQQSYTTVCDAWF